MYASRRDHSHPICSTLEATDNSEVCNIHVRVDARVRGALHILARELR